ncbi:MAG: hypothetical protein CVU53_03865 [Deltaproteobacteria bacterium HGW-Deltaproteobacteria-11]|nr:MAG: hypothetical protein CVU53_03865 [Deltaproteobacteria bacterium HGW-Deltaproteobacteria-11]
MAATIAEVLFVILLILLVHLGGLQRARPWQA